MTVAELRSRISGREWVEWNIYYGRIAQRGQLAAQAANARR